MSQTTVDSSIDTSVDTQYRELLQSILDHGVRGESQQEVDALTLIAPKPLRFDLNKGFPIITERKISEKCGKGRLAKLSVSSMVPVPKRS